MLHDQLRNLKNDHRSGAREILKKAAAILTKSQSPEVIEAVLNSHPDMAPLHHLCERACNAQHPTEEISALLKEIDQAPKEIAYKFFSLLPENLTMMTYSRSSTVEESLLMLQKLGKVFQMVAPESRPGMEGREFCRNLGKAGVESLLMTDAAALSKIRYVDCLVIGADRVTPPIFVNKVGTLGFTMLAKHFGVPVYLLYDRSKYVKKWTRPTDLETHDASEVCEQTYPGVQVANPYFEEIPLELITTTVTN